MKFRYLAFVLTAILAISACANTNSNENIAVYPSLPTISRPYLPIEVNVQSDASGSLPEFPVSGDTSHYRAYLQASNNDRYRIRVSNNTGQRVGVVIAVDGRNIISGQKSYLQNTERMYILNPHTSGEYEGWRTGSNQVNRFYFSEAVDSYAAAWGDHSAMGVIAMSVYPEVRPIINYGRSMMKGAPASPSSAAREAAPGTGYGETTYSPSVTVNFKPLPEPIEKVFLKYEWRESLCKKGILSTCQNPPQTNENRFWPSNDGYAPPPPRRRY